MRCALVLTALSACWTGTEKPAASPTPVTSPTRADVAPVAEDDHDGDRIVAPCDLCPDEPETFNGLSDADGCPDSGTTASVPVPYPDDFPAACREGWAP